jgi:hypothetical protein
MSCGSSGLSNRQGRGCGLRYPCLSATLTVIETDCLYRLEKDTSGKEKGDEV